MPEISVIVPVYKVEPYLRRCVDSILSQTFKDFELILVDDGSPDGCPGICDGYAICDSRVKVIHQRNSGVSAARNSGINIARGKYILFCDSDDYMSEEWLDTLLKSKSASHNTYICGGYVYEFSDSSRNKIMVLSKNDRIFELPIGCFLKLQLKDVVGYVWNVLFYTDIIHSYNIHFQSEFGNVNEDLSFCLNYLEHMNSISFVNYPGYHYWQAENDSTLSRRYYRESFCKWQEKYRMLENFVETRIPGAEQLESKKLLADYYLYIFLDALNNTFDSRNSLSWRQKMCYNQNVVHTPEFRKCISLADGSGENPRYLSLLKKGNYYAAYLYACAAKMKSHLKR